MGCCTPRRLLIYHLVTAILGIIAGSSSFGVFTFYYHNYHAGVWGLSAFLLSCVNLHIHLLHKNNRLHEVHSERSLIILAIIGAGVTVGAFIAMICYIAISEVEHIPMMPADKSLYMGATQSFLAFKYAMSLAYCSRQYSRNLQMEYGLVG